MPALAIHPDAREFLAATTDSRCRRVPLARTKRELAKAAYAEVADGLRPTPLFAGFIADAPPERETEPAGRFNLIGPFVLQASFWAVVIAALIHIGAH